jgi:hypothetical protein
MAANPKTSGEPIMNRRMIGWICAGGGVRKMPWGIVALTVLWFCQSVPGADTIPSPKPGNAAADYRRAFEEVARLPETDAVLPGPNDPLPPRDKSEPIASRLESALKCLHEATAKKDCDWESDLYRKGAAATFPHIPMSRDLVGRALFRARCYWHSGKREQAIEDVRAVLVLAHRVGDEGKSGLLGLTERYKIEQSIVHVLRLWMTDAPSAKSLDGLFQLALPTEGNLPKVGLLRERETILPWTRRLVTASNLSPEEQQWRDQFFGKMIAEQGAPWILQKLDEAKVRYTEVGDLMDLPIDQFVPRFAQYIQKLNGSGNPFTQVAIVECPGIPGAYLQSRNLRAQWTILKAASGVFQLGPAAVKKFVDPYGDGPLQYQIAEKGFTIGSALVIDKKPVELSFTRNIKN